MVNKKIQLHFTLGPIQGFVAQARRTRDLWAGSYLLSYLSGKAMLATGGKTLFPAVKEDPLMKVLRGDAEPPAKSDIAAQVGSLPNRFVAEVEDEEAGERAKLAIKDTWEKIAKAVWDEYVAKTNPSPATKEIWKRQIENTWDCAWVFGADGTLLDQRKNLRTYFTPDEHGEKCTVCGERQEISSGGLGTKSSRDGMRKWWSDFRNNTTLSVLNLREKERLCAVCLVKRLFPKVSKTAICWQVPIGFPSVSYMAAVEWIERVMKSGNKPEIDKTVEKFITACMNAEVGKSEQETRIAGISNELGLEHLKGNHWKTLADLDGSVFFEDSIRNKNSLALKDDGKRNEIISALRAVQQAIGVKATPFYAMLLMDGDSMGALLSGKSDEKKKQISAALGAFGNAVPNVVKECDGRLIYCGGDDVFALLPMERTLECARRCKEEYQKAFQGIVELERATISAAIVYAHIHVPLSVVIHQSHELLNEIAKRRTGRDAVACQVYKPGGITLTWAMPWKKMLEVKPINSEEKLQTTLVEEVLTRFQDNSGNPTQFSSKFFYRMGEIFDLLADENGKLIFDPDAAKKLLAAEYLANRELEWPKNLTDGDKLEETEFRVGRLLALCTEYRRTLDTDSRPIKESFSETGRLTDGALLVRFLAQKGVD